jgi:hypothetical protein
MQVAQTSARSMEPWLLFEALWICTKEALNKPDPTQAALDTDAADAPTLGCPFRLDSGREPRALLSLGADCLFLLCVS